MLNAHADTKGVRQSPTMSAAIVTNTESSMLVTAGGIISQERADKNVDMGGSGKLNERVEASLTACDDSLLICAIDGEAISDSPSTQPD